eukprot:XP_019076369.1 PREDICTED: histone deacetylase 8 isoform X2 [Vitis vinifera]
MAGLSPSGGINVFWHEGMLKHDTGIGVFDTGMDPGFLDVLEKHPENSERLRNMVSILKRGPISPYISWHSGTPALISHLLSFHTPEYINELVQADRDGGKELCSGTFLNPGSWDAALLAAGLAVQLALNSGCAKVAVIDIDVHYGNGTAEGFYHSDKVLTISLHMNHGSWGPSHPQSGSVDEIGVGEGFGYNLNIPLPNGTGDRGYAYAMNQLVVPAIQKYEPEMMVLVVGQDSSAFDPNGRQCLTMEGYREIGQIVRKLADKYSDGHLLIVQEGGYQVTYSAYCLHATLEGVLNLPSPLLSDPIAYYPEDELMTTKVIDAIKKFQNSTAPFLKGG